VGDRLANSGALIAAVVRVGRVRVEQDVCQHAAAADHHQGPVFDGVVVRREREVVVARKGEPVFRGHGAQAAGEVVEHGPSRTLRDEDGLPTPLALVVARQLDGLGGGGGDKRADVRETLPGCEAAQGFVPGDADAEVARVHVGVDSGAALSSS
jgi:hypothetical protein